MPLFNVYQTVSYRHVVEADSAEEALEHVKNSFPDGDVLDTEYEVEEL